MFRTAIAGSLPKPGWLAETNKLWPKWAHEGDALQQAKLDATLMWIKAQEDAGLTTIGDGEQSRERLMDLVAFFAHRRVTRLPEAQLTVIEALHQSDSPLEGRKVLIVDDDIRNIYALRSVLEEHNMAVQSAGNGRDALRLMAGANPIDIVLMDIMMPEMDGIATMREARKIRRDLPIVAVTAKAMKGDRERCMEAGAWDYLSKPVDPHHLLAVLRSWLHR